MEPCRALRGLHPQELKAAQKDFSTASAWNVTKDGVAIRLLQSEADIEQTSDFGRNCPNCDIDAPNLL
jgi:hypothetical protein